MQIQAPLALPEEPSRDTDQLVGDPRAGDVTPGVGERTQHFGVQRTLVGRQAPDLCEQVGGARDDGHVVDGANDRLGYCRSHELTLLIAGDTLI